MDRAKEWLKIYGRVAAACMAHRDNWVEADNVAERLANEGMKMAISKYPEVKKVTPPPTPHPPPPRKEAAPKSKVKEIEIDPEIKDLFKKE